MFNQWTLNYNTFNYSEAAMFTFSGKLGYGNYTMPNSNFRLTDIIGLNDFPEIQDDIFDKANVDGMGLRDFLYKRKPITVKGSIHATDKYGLVGAINSFKAELGKHNQTLLFLDDDGTLKTATAYCRNLRVNMQRWTINVVRVEFDIIILDPFIYSNATNQTAFVTKSANFTDTVQYNGGNRRAKPIITMTFGTGLSGVTSVEVQIGDNIITINEAISDSSSLVIDCKDQDVLLNSVGNKDYLGVFPFLDRWDNSITVTINGTRNADIYVARPDTYA